MLDSYKELTPVSYDESGIKYLSSQSRKGICFYMHWHDRMELLYVESGVLELYLNEQRLTVLPGQTAVISPRMLHAGFAGESGVAYHTIMFDAATFCNSTSASDRYLLPLCRYEITFSPICDHTEVRRAILHLIQDLHSPQNVNSLSTMSHIYALLGGLYQNGIDTSHSVLKTGKHFRPILEYINAHYTEDLSAHTVSKTFGYNEAYFCRRFKSVTGLTVMKYIQILRMEAAQRLLLDNTLAIGSVALECGYTDISYFSNCFKKHVGCSPNEFRKRMTKSVDKLH